MMQDYYFTNKTKEVTKMNEKNKKIAAWGFIVTLIIASVTIFKSLNMTQFNMMSQHK